MSVIAAGSGTTSMPMIALIVALPEMVFRLAFTALVGIGHAGQTLKAAEREGGHEEEEEEVLSPCRKSLTWPGRAGPQPLVGILAEIAGVGPGTQKRRQSSLCLRTTLHHSDAPLVGNSRNDIFEHHEAAVRGAIRMKRRRRMWRK